MYNPNEIYQHLIKSGEEYADIKAAYLLFDSMTKPYLSEAFKRAEGTSISERKEHMYSDPVYIEHLKKLGDARKDYLLAEVRYKSMQALADARRTEASTRRAEAQYVSMSAT